MSRHHLEPTNDDFSVKKDFGFTAKEETIIHKLKSFSYLFSSMLRLCGQIIVCIMGLCDAAKQHCNHTYKDNKFQVHIKGDFPTFVPRPVFYRSYA